MDHSPHQTTRIPTSGDMSPQGFQDPNQGPGYQEDNIRFRGIITFGVCLTVLTGVIMFATAYVMGIFAFDQKSRAREHPEQFAVTIGQFPQPQLQQHDKLDMDAFYKQEIQTLGSYGWTDPKAHVARIPVDRAMSLLANAGSDALKAKTPVPAPADSAPAPAPTAAP